VRKPNLRRATTRDLDVLVRHRRLMWIEIGGVDASDLDDADRTYRRWARVRLASGRLLGWIVERGGRAGASGCVWLQEVHPRPGYGGGIQPYLLSMYTEPDERGRGHAARIVDAAMRWSDARGYPRLALHASPAGRGIYERAGFKRTWEMRRERDASAT
jgi:GNAT superfamily N-acetyltransferase